MTALYSEIEPYPSTWLRNLAEEGLIAPSVVLEGDIRDLHPKRLAQHTQVHLFAGIGRLELRPTLGGLVGRQARMDGLLPLSAILDRWEA